MRSRRWRLAVAVVVVGLVGLAGWVGWQAWQVKNDLKDAEASATALRDSLGGGDPAVRDRAVRDLQESAGSAKGRTDGPTWGLLTHLPIVGDDATGVQAVSRSLDTLVSKAAPPLIETVDQLDGINSDGRLDLDVVEGLAGPVGQAQKALVQADADVSALDSSGYAGGLQSSFNRYADIIHDTSQAMTAAQKAVSVLPTMAGADGPRNYLLVFQNNAEIRATGGMPGSWALVHADAGRLEMVRQGTAGDFGERSTPVLPLTKAEVAVYDRQLGTYFQDAGFTPDFPRAAQLLAARWEEGISGPRLDGVIALDPVAMSYMLKGTGNIQVGDLILTSDNLVEQMLNRPYLDLDPTQQDALFAKVAKALFDSATRDLPSPLEFVGGLDRAAREGRFLVAPFDSEVRDELAGSRVEGALSSDDGTTPHVDIGLNDATGSKMSYYLRYWANVHSTACIDGEQMLAGSMTVSQAIPPKDAAELPRSVTGGGYFGTDPGSQLVLVRIYGPYGGTIDAVRMDGRSLGRDLDVVDLDGRPVATLVVLLSTKDDVVITWTMATGVGQTASTVVQTTPSVVPGGNRSVVESAC